VSTPLRVAARGLNLRRGAGTDQSVTQLLEQRTLVVPGGRSGDGLWTSVGVPELKLSGWVASRFLEPIPKLEVGDPLWTALLLARLGEREILGPQHNPWVLRCHACTELHALDDETAWCSAAECWAFESAGIRSTHSAAAASWRTWGVRLDRPRRGCIVVIPRHDRNNPHAAHVAQFFGSAPGTILLLGGNQHNQLSISGFPDSVHAEYRWPAGL
jgi:uncharacterized protein (TIGR02594 family)